MNIIEHHFHRESVVHILLEEDACSALHSTGTGANHQKAKRINVISSLAAQDVTLSLSLSLSNLIGWDHCSFKGCWKIVAPWYGLLWTKHQGIPTFPRQITWKACSFCQNFREQTMVCESRKVTYLGWPYFGLHCTKIKLDKFPNDVLFFTQINSKIPKRSKFWLHFHQKYAVLIWLVLVGAFSLPKLSDLAFFTNLIKCWKSTTSAGTTCWPSVAHQNVIVVTECSTVGRQQQFVIFVCFIGNNVFLWTQKSE